MPFGSRPMQRKLYALAARNYALSSHRPLTVLDLAAVASPAPRRRRGAPADRAVTTELAPTTQRSPTLTPLVTTQLTPNQTLSPISTGPLRGESLPGDRHLGIVEAMLGVADEAAVGEHHVVADRHLLLGGDHRVAVEEAALADLDLGLGRQRHPAAGLEQRAFADPQAALVERLEHLALDRLADEEAAAGGVAGEAEPAGESPVALVPAPLRPPDAPAGLPMRPRPRCTGTP